MKLAARIIWRLLEWPVNIALCLLPAWAAWHFIAPEMLDTKSGPKPDYFGPGMAAFIAAAVMLITLGSFYTALELTLTGWLKSQAVGIVKEEREKMQVEKGEASKDTYLRPVE